MEDPTGYVARLGGTMAVALARQGHSIDVHDVDAVREWLMERVRQDVRAKGCPHPRIHLVGDGFEESLDLDAMSKQQPQAHAGATFQGLRSRLNIERRFVVMLADATRHDDTHALFAVLIEEIDGDEGRRRWWMAMLPYTVDPRTGVGIPADDWELSDGETSNASRIPPDFRAMVLPPPGAKSATVLGPGLVPPDIRVLFDDLPPGAPVPATAVDMVHLAHHLAINDLVTGVIGGNVVIRLVGRAFEMFILGDHQPADLNDMIRYIANTRKPQAEAVVLVQVAIMPFHNPPVPGIYTRAECAGQDVEAFVTLAYPEGPAGRKIPDQLSWRPPRPLPEDGVWLGVDPHVLFDLGPLGADA